MSDDLVDYAESVATDDVTAAIRWLRSQGFEVVAGRGGRQESFGNVSLTFAQNENAMVEINRDRSQWFCSIAAGGQGNRVPLNVLITAMTGHAPVVETAAFLPLQLPEGVAWRQAIPDAIEWLIEDDRSDVIEAADHAWRAAMRDRLGYDST